ncbi:CU044_5270 family protein [Actinomadura opuntiae]|uniref:CU044_5270 family protein n=1 Tax=Actinomadura sp. OS1-43 TaxID=604315 RepID=UPI00255A71FF|nr:CU044_5270 family protein [Actinomadura sp. OS1-43]MDL4819018.1 CU044_5270 family protein [Actinomadura sp. OS1-43]
MDEMTMLREAKPDVAPPADAALRAGRDRLTAAARPARRWPRLPKPAVMGLLAGTAAVATAAAITVAQVVAPDGHGSATAAAAEVLRDAAATARSGPPVRPGPYSYTREVIVHPGRTGEKQCTETWLRRDGSMAAFATYSERYWGRCDSKNRPRRTPALGSGHDDQRPHADVRTLPTDPSALRARLYSDAAHGRGQNPDNTGSRDQLVFDRIGRLLSMTLPPELRAALFQTLATIPGVDAVRGERDALGRQGIALARSFDDRTTPGSLAIILAPNTYRYLGRKAVQDIGEGYQTDLTALLTTAVVTKPFQRP